MGDCACEGAAEAEGDGGVEMSVFAGAAGKQGEDVVVGQAGLLVERRTKKQTVWAVDGIQIDYLRDRASSRCRIVWRGEG